MRLGLVRQLRQRAVVIQARHGREVARIEIAGVACGDERVGIGGIADHQHLHVAVGDFVERAALHGKDLRVGEQQVLALHARAARARADQQRHLTVAEREARVVGRHHLPECWKRAVVQLHHHALQRRERRGDLEQMQVHARARPEQRTRGDTEGEGIADLSGGAGDGNVHGGCHGGRFVLRD